MLPRLSSLGYREVTLAQETLLGPAGGTLRGHEFHYSEIIDDSKARQRVYRMSDRRGATKSAEGYLEQRTLGSYVHLHWGSFPAAARYFVESCMVYRCERTATP